MIITRKGFKTALVTDVLDWVRISGLPPSKRSMRRKEIPTRLKINVTNRRALELGALEYLRRPLDVLETLIRKNAHLTVVT